MAPSSMMETKDYISNTTGLMPGSVYNLENKVHDFLLIKQLGLGAMFAATHPSQSSDGQSKCKLQYPGDRQVVPAC